MKLNYKKVFYVGLAFFLISMFWQTYDNLITKILIDKFGLNQTWSGVVMAMDNVLALILIPLFGGLSDKTNTKYGKRTPYIIVGTIIAAFAFIGLTFSDNYQTTKLKTETQIVDQYEDMQDKVMDYDDWMVLKNSIVSQWDDLKNSGVIDQDAYDKFYFEVIDGVDTDDATEEDDYDYDSDRREGMLEILGPVDRTLTEKDQADLKEFFYLHLQQSAWIETTRSPGAFIAFAGTLFIALLSMATFRSPAVALMPDVTVKPLRSKGNAVINLMGAVGGISAIGIMTLFSLDKLSYVNYGPAFITVGILMIVFLGIILWKVKEPKLVKEKEQEDLAFNLNDEENEAEKLHESVDKLSKEKKTSLILILFSVALWFMGYNAVTTKLSDYAPKVLEMGFSLPLLIAQGTAIVAFIPVGLLSTKIGRKRAIQIGVVLLTICFGSVYFLKPSSAFIMYFIFALTGAAWAMINVNSYPMVVELAKGSDVGKYTGFYYTFSMAAQILTPILSGILMDATDRTALFPYATFFVAMAFITMLFVKHGDAKVEKKDSLIENFDVDMD
jgi:MFS family permease